MRIARRLLAVVGVALVLVAGGLAWLLFGDRALPAGAVTVDVPSGYGIGQIGQQLQDAGVVRFGVLLRYYARARGVAARVNAAEYDFPPHQTLAQVLDTLAAGGHPAVVWLTVPEGYTARQIAHRLEALHIGTAAEFIDVVQHTPLLLGGTLTHGLEGFLYPDTYQIARTATPRAIASQMTDEFVKKLPPHYEVSARRLGYSVPDIITIASIIEREARVDSERRLMAGVYYNRLQRGMPLEVDATIEYALPEHKTVLHYSDLAVDSPYNSYTHSGLPPTPISNPGSKSIYAAFNPQHSDYLYYVYAGHGRHHFSRTLQEQQNAVRRYLR